MKTTPLASLALLAFLGCGSVSTGADGGDASGAAGAAGAGGGMDPTGAAGHGGAGSGGAGATGGAGHGGAGSGGAGSTGAAGHDAGVDVRGTSCNDLSSQYAEALNAARSCTVGASAQCEQAVSSSLSPCFSNCQTYVNDSTTLDGLKAQWLGEGCNNQGVIACPAIACLQPTKGNCVAADGGGGQCTNKSVLTTN
jgi:hypothetical protein